ncbi:alpha/beta hydrolase [Thermoleptolyngbya sichuanensis A183]|uniref:Alpha/beta hydrolase n=1 Tax=Thermoleptolyngbya sichuanensis A183 TaxID=2737172 RepID=A0A6M8B8R0_9CYAN|nr:MULTISPECIES: alpha/beta hydrolase [Thermoleptolyngbya]QKD83799.1 alpha/beta hydrolase [Thermoleptolyngbya sichuanensis A183]
MGATQLEEALPYRWAESSAGREACANDQRWLGGIVANAAPFSDWWAKARIVQLAYEPMYDADPAVYQGKADPRAIADALHNELKTHAQAFDWAQCQERYPGFCRLVDEEYVIKTLNHWKRREFTKAIGRNFEVYRYLGQEGKQGECGEWCTQNTFLVVSTASVSLAVERSLPNPKLFRPLFNVDELAEIIHQRNIRALTLRTHGYANPAGGFYKFLSDEANYLFAKPKPGGEPTDTLGEEHLYIGYHWPSEQPVFNRGLIRDSMSNLEILMKFLGSLLLLSFIPSVVLIGLTELAEKIDLVRDVGPQWHLAIAAGVFFLWLSLLMLLRSVVYQRDRYRAIHYGAPDLAEFFWRLDKSLKRLMLQDMGLPERDERVQLALKRSRKLVNLIGHSMGGLVLVNVLRVLSDRFGKDDQESNDDGLGDCLKLGKLILASPDIPLELLREGRNNYVRSAIRRCEQIYLMSSDRDIVLRYLSTLGNWFSEPSVEMSGLRLGNVFLPPNPEKEIQKTPRRKRRREQLKILLIRGAILTRQAVRPTSAYDLFENFSYLDCSKMKGVNAVALELNPFTAIPIDAINTFFYLTGRIDVHGGYFFTYTPTFKLLPFLMQVTAPSEEDVRHELDRFDERDTIRFLYRAIPTPGSVDIDTSVVESDEQSDIAIGSSEAP